MTLAPNGRILLILFLQIADSVWQKEKSFRVFRLKIWQASARSSMIVDVHSTWALPFRCGKRMKCSSDFCGGFTLFLRSHASKGDVIQFTPLLLIVVHSVMYTNFLSCMYLKLLSWSVHLGRLGECCIFREVCILCCRSIMSFHHYLNPA